MSVNPHNTDSQYIRFDDNNRTFLIVDTDTVYSYDEIAEIEYKEEHGTLGHRGIARAFSISLFDDLRGVFIATEITIRIQLKNEHGILISFLKTPVKSNTLVYRLIKQQADNVLAKLNEINPHIGSTEQTLVYANELRELKRLVDEGVITQADFEMKKNKLLGI